METVIKGMVQVDGATYRIVRLKHGQYNVVRILDDVSEQAFEGWAALEVQSVGIAGALTRSITRVAVQRAKISCVGRLALG
ncbi:MAG: hypothetical protein ABIQ16_28165 [Polyangiaceae bacterium]